MNIAATKGGFRARLSVQSDDIAACLALRRAVFRADASNDQDDLDAHCQHLLIEDSTSGQLLACARVMIFKTTSDISNSYSARFYGLERLTNLKCPMLELGRFCMTPHPEATNLLRTAWGQLTRIVDEHGIGFLFGCSSFHGDDPAAFAAPLAYLHANHLGPEAQKITVKSPQTFALPSLQGDAKAALQSMPPLLRSYLAMGGWVSDHGVIDRDLGTCHVFTAVEIAKIPPARARALRAIASIG